MDWNDIRYFLALARSGSLSAAARILEVTHVSVGSRLAAAGERLLSAGEAVEKACMQFERQMIGLSDVPEGLLTVSVPETTWQKLRVMLKLPGGRCGSRNPAQQ